MMQRVGHSEVPQVTLSFNAGHTVPLFCGNVVMLRVRTEMPPPQEAEQLLQEDQFPTSQFTTQPMVLQA